MSYLTLVPAYGRDYKSQKEVREAFKGGSDFQIAGYGPHDGQYVSFSELSKGDTAMIRYAKLTKVVSIRV